MDAEKVRIYIVDRTPGGFGVEVVEWAPRTPDGEPSPYDDVLGLAEPLQSARRGPGSGVIAQRAADADGRDRRDPVELAEIRRTDRPDDDDFERDGRKRAATLLRLGVALKALEARRRTDAEQHDRGRPDAVAPASIKELPKEEPTKEELPKADAYVEGPSRRGRAGLTKSVALSAAVIAVVCALAIVLRGQPGGSAPASTELTRPAQARLVAWLMENTGRQSRIVVPPDVRRRLARQLPGREVMTDARSGAHLLVSVGIVAPPSDAAVLARFDGARQPIGVLQPLAAGTTRQADARRRARVGRRLVETVNLRLTPRAWQSLASGGVDLSVSSFLATLCRRHTVEVASFQRDRPAMAARAPSRTVTITALDGKAPALASIEHLLPGRIEGMRLQRVVHDGQSVLVARALLPTTGTQPRLEGTR